MNGMEKKFATLLKIARALNDNGICWAVGSSCLLYFNDILDDFRDLDLMVMNEDAIRARDILAGLGKLVEAKYDPHFNSRLFFQLEIDGMEIDLIGSFVICLDGKEYDCSLKKEEINDYRLVDGVIIPLHSIRLWKKYYGMMGRPHRVAQIESHRSDEEWDVYDADFNKTGKTAIRGDKLDEGCYHLVSLVIVRHVDGQYLVMKRYPRKLYGGYYELTSGGSAKRGETAIEAARRELFEETGIRANELRLLAKETDSEKSTHYAIYEYVTDMDKDAIVLQDKETVGYRWVNRDELLRLCTEECVAFRTKKYIM